MSKLELAVPHLNSPSGQLCGTNPLKIIPKYHYQQESICIYQDIKWEENIPDMP